MKCAIITPGFLPVPAVKGGAVEVLIEELIKSNESEKIMKIYLYTIPDKRLNDIQLKECKIIQVKIDLFSKIKSKIYHVIHNKPGHMENVVSPFGVAVNKRIKKERFDYIIIENNMSVFNAINNNSKKIFHLHNNILEQDYSRSEYLCKKVINESECILNVSNYLAKRMNSVINTPKNKVLYNCVDFNIFDYKNVSKENVSLRMKKYRINKKSFKFVYTGRIAEEKGVYELVEAFKNILKIYPDCKLIIAGQGWFGKNVESPFEKKMKIITQNIKKSIIFTGYINHNDVPEIIEMADCVVIPSKWEEPFGVVAIEAMAMKKPIISTKTGGLCEVLDDESAILIEKEDLKTNIYNAMIDIIQNIKKRKKIAENAYMKVHSNKYFDKEQYFKNFIETTNLKNTKNILIVNQGETENYGDIAINDTMVKYFSNAGYNVNQCSFWNECEIFGKNYNSYDNFIKKLLWRLPWILDFFNRRHINKIFKNTNKFDVAIIGGGELLYGHKGFNSSLYYWAKLLNKKNIPLYIYGVSGDTKMKKSRLGRYKKALNMCSKVIVRDKNTQEICKNIYGVDSIYKPDAVFSYKLVKTTGKIEGNDRNMLLCIPLLYNLKMKENLNLDNEMEYFEYLNKKLEENIEGITKICITSTAADDDDSSKRFYNYINNKYSIDVIYKKYTNLDDYIELLKGSKTVVSGRMHAMILGLIYGCKIEPIEFKEKLEVFKKEFYNLEDISLIEKESYEGLELLKSYIG